MVDEEEQSIELNFLQVKCDPFNPAEVFDTKFMTPNRDNSYASNDKVLPDNDDKQSNHSFDEEYSEENVLLPVKRKLRNRLVPKLELVDIMTTKREMKEMNFPPKKKRRHQKSLEENDSEAIVAKKIELELYQTRIWKCLGCDLMLENQQKYEKHMKKWHPEDKRIYRCSIEACSKGSETLTLCRKHEITHLPDEQKKIYLCPHCDRKFSQKPNMVSHVRSVHIKIKVQPSYHVHRSIHLILLSFLSVICILSSLITDQQTFICDQCGKK